MFFLQKKKIPRIEIQPLWKTESPVTKRSVPLFRDKFEVFGCKIDENNIKWHTDYISGFSFSLKQFDMIKTSKYFNRGIDVKFPWELSRFTFISPLAANFYISGNTEYYKTGKNHITNWINANPFLKGINWKCTMDVAIRAINWLLAASVFHENIMNDPEFHRTISGSLVRHAEYISAFPERYKKDHTTNHTTSDYAGLLFLAVALKKHPKSHKWKKQALDGILDCMNYQVYDDGGSFEASTSYHRLVTELFALVALLCLNNDIRLPDSYFRKLYLMFEFAVAYTDKKGNSPVMGDNDSGTILQSDFNQNNNYTYLADLRSFIFEVPDGNTNMISKTPSLLILPENRKVDPGKIAVQPVTGIDNHFFKNSGLCIMNSNDLKSVVGIIPVGQNGHGGHNHYDCGSFTLSDNAGPVVVDPGVYTYTRDIRLRNKFRSYSYHNTVLPHELDQDAFFLDKTFESSKYFELLDHKMENNNIFDIKYRLLDLKKPVSRKFVLEKDLFVINDGYDGDFILHIHFSPDIKIKDISINKILSDRFTLFISHAKDVKTEEYDYSARYNIMEKSSRIIIFANDYNELRFDFK